MNVPKSRSKLFAGRDGARHGGGPATDAKPRSDVSCSIDMQVNDRSFTLSCDATSSWLSRSACDGPPVPVRHRARKSSTALSGTFIKTVLMYLVLSEPSAGSRRGGLAAVYLIASTGLCERVISRIPAR